MAVVAICDANILIDYSKSDISVISKIAEYYGQVYVPDIILQEVGIISEEEAAKLGITIVETPLELEEVPALSYQDRTCLYYVKKYKCTCLTNDKALRKHCETAGGTVVWGLEMLLKLVEGNLLTATHAEKIARKINQVNPEINEKVLSEFLEKLSKI
jgi:rRNA-processing protein FCF1